MIINTNIQAMNAWRSFNNIGRKMDKSLNQLATGRRINSAADDAAGLAISSRMKSNVAGMEQAVRNSLNGITMIQVGEGAYNEIEDNLITLKKLALDSMNDTLTDADRTLLQQQVTSLLGEITASAGIQYNGKDLINGSGVATNIQTGVKSGQNVSIAFNSLNATSAGLGIDAIDIGTSAGATTALGLIDTAINTVSSQRSTLGSAQNRLESTIRNLEVGIENISAAKSRIVDVDMAKLQSEITKQQILSQSSLAAMAQANMRPQMVLQLLG